MSTIKYRLLKNVILGHLPSSPLIPMRVVFEQSPLGPVAKATVDLSVVHAIELEAEDEAIYLAKRTPAMTPAMWKRVQELALEQALEARQRNESIRKGLRAHVNAKDIELVEPEAAS